MTEFIIQVLWGRGMKYTVRFERYYTYEIEADNEDEAFDNAYEEYQSDMRYPIADTWYDWVSVDCEEDEDEGYGVM